MRGRRSIWNFSTQILGAVLGIGLTVVATPYLLHWLGSERFGVTRVLADVIGYLVLLELGLSEAAIPLIAAGQDGEGANSLRSALAVTIQAQLRMLPIKLVVGLGLTAVAPLLVPASAAVAPEIRAACIFAVLGTMLSPLIPFRVLLETRQKGYFVNAALFVQQLVITALAVALARAGFGVGGQMLAIFLGAAVFFAIVVLKAWPLAAGLGGRDLLKQPEPLMWQRLWRLNWTQLMANACGRISTLTDNLIIATMLSPSYVTAFYVTQRTASVVQSQLFGIGNATWAALAELHGQGHLERFRQRLLELTRLLVTAGLVAVGPLVAFNRQLVSLWVGADAFGGSLLGAAAGANAIFAALIALWSWVFSATGRSPELLPQYKVYTLINLAASILLTKWLGISGPVLGTTVAALAVSLWLVPLYLRRSFGVPLTGMVYACGRPLLWLGPAVAGLFWGGSGRDITSWGMLVAHLLAAGCSLAALAWFGAFTAAERCHWWAALRSVAPRWPIARSR